MNSTDIIKLNTTFNDSLPYLGQETVHVVDVYRDFCTQLDNGLISISLLALFALFYERFLLKDIIIGLRESSKYNYLNERYRVMIEDGFRGIGDILGIFYWGLPITMLYFMVPNNSLNSLQWVLSIILILIFVVILFDIAQRIYRAIKQKAKENEN